MAFDFVPNYRQSLVPHLLPGDYVPLFAISYDADDFVDTGSSTVSRIDQQELGLVSTATYTCLLRIIVQLFEYLYHYG